MKPAEFDGHAPTLLVEEYFAGPTQAWGIFQDRSGRVRRQFMVDMEGTLFGDTLTLVEDFRYDNDETEQRIWHITRRGVHRYEGRADGVVGIAEGLAYGNALRWTYRFDLKVGARTWRVRFEDWLFLQSDGVLINRAVVTKFGIRLGDITLAFRKRADAAQL